jgi:hypothetical protein
MRSTIGGADLREIVTLEPVRKATFFQATGPRGRHRQRVVRGRSRHAPAPLPLLSRLRDKEPNGPEEQAEQAQFDSDQGYKAALLSTLKRTRELVAEGRL